ncbi:MAG: GTPase HflX [Myxococcales bacterium]|nr:GTPase HflX [Myxococcales bacterium]
MKFQSTPIEEHEEAPLADEGRLENLVTHWTEREASVRANGNRCYVVAVRLRGQTTNLAEILGLVEAQGDSIVGQEEHELVKPDPRTLIRSGTANRIGNSARECGANLLVFDAELSPSQARNLEDATGLPVCDREAVILNVFQRHARTTRARIQVELAHLQYLRPRIRGIGLNMDQQAGGMTAARGPGETASELLARRLDGRLAVLRRELERLQHADDGRRKHRARCHRVVLVGYTNAGKTSLMNALTSAELSVRDRPFETLDTTARCLTRHGGDVLLSDTVGFIRRLPERLLESFDSTLAEIREASLLLLVIDAADPEIHVHLQTTRQVLTRLGAEAVPRLLVFNKADLLNRPLDGRTLEQWSDGHPYLALSSHDRDAVSGLRESVLKIARQTRASRSVFVPYEATAATKLIYARCRVTETTPEEAGMRFGIEAEVSTLAELDELIGRVRA